jgi:hypothetical protein
VSTQPPGNLGRAHQPKRFDKPLAELFDMQDEIVARLANALNAQFVAAEARRAEKVPSPDSMDSIFRVWLGSIRV